MKRYWSKFGSYSIQFFIVVLGVFVTLWIGNIAERAKENRKTRETLELIREELVLYMEGDMQEKERLFEQEKKMYYDIFLYVLGAQPLPDVETLIEYRNTFLYISMSSIKHMSLDIAETSGILSNIKDLSLIESIYSAFGHIAIIHQITQDNINYKIDRLVNSASPDKTKTIFNYSENASADITYAFWNEVTTNPELYRTIINGTINTQMIEEALISGKEEIQKTIDKITDYIR